MFCKKSTIQNTLSSISSISYRRCSDNMFIDNQQILSNEIVNVWYITGTLITASEGQQITNTIDFPATSASVTKYYVYSKGGALRTDALTACNDIVNGGDSLILIGYTTKPLPNLQPGDVIYNMSNLPITVSANRYRALSESQNNSTTAYVIYYQTSGSSITSITSCNNIILTPTQTPSNTVTPTVTPTPSVTETSGLSTPTPTPTSTQTPTPSLTQGLTPSPTPTNTSTPTITPTVTPSTQFNLYLFSNCCPPFDSVTVAVAIGIDIPQDSGLVLEENCYYYDNFSVNSPDFTVIDPSLVIEQICLQPACACVAVTPTQTQSPTVTPTQTKTPTNTASSSPTPSNTITQTPTTTNTLSQTSTPTVTKTQTLTPTNTASPTSTFLTTPTQTSSPTPSSTDFVISSSFVSTWETTTPNQAIQLPLLVNGSYNFVVNWGDGQYETITSYSGNSHTYSSIGTYTISIIGEIQGWSFSATSTSKNVIKTISQWGSLKINNGSNQVTGAFLNCTSLTLNGLVDSLNTSGVTTMNSWFDGCTSLTTFPYLSNLTMSGVTNTSSMFKDCVLFNAPMTGWNMSSIINMSGMFNNCSSFNQDLSSWIVGSSMSISSAFLNCPSFNSPLFSGAAIGNMFSTFRGCSSFNQPLTQWNVYATSNFAYAFSGCSNFNQNISYWNTSQALGMTGMFSNASSFDQDISSWCVSSIPTKPTDFDNGTSVSWTTAEKPNWGAVCV